VVDALQNITLENVVGGDAGKTAFSTISFGQSEGLLKISGDITAAIKIVANRTSGDFSDKEVSIERTGISTVNDLEVLGLVETLSLGGVLDEDLILFTTGGSNDQLDLYASYESSGRDFLHQRERTTDFIFTSSSSYQIVDRATETVLSERTWSLGEPISYGVIALSIEGQPNVGDVFSVDGNRSGVASNENALRVADLEELGLASDGKSLKESYFSILTQAGNSARRAEVSREALDVVYQQSVQAKDSKVGVNLDEEAAELIRFQQAYQASAKVMQMANQLFDSILRI
jgi:flagellar hook-associated protein FlgK